MKKFLQWLGFKPYEPFQKAKASEILGRIASMIEEGWSPRVVYTGLDDNLCTTYSLVGAIYLATQELTGTFEDAPYIVDALIEWTIFWRPSAMGMGYETKIKALTEVSASATNKAQILELIEKTKFCFEAKEAEAVLKASAEARDAGHAVIVELLKDKEK